MMKQLNIILYIIGLCLLPMQTTHAQLLYEISGNSVAEKSYIFALNRLTTIQFLDTVPNLFKVYGRCNKVVCEMAAQDYEVQRAIANAALLSDSAQLRDHYTAEEYHIIDDALRITLGISLDDIGRLRPQYITEMYRTELLRKWLGYDENTSMENFFQTVAAQQGIPILPLDNTSETLYMLFEHEPMHHQLKQLLNIVQYPEREIQIEKTLQQQYRMGLLTEMSYTIQMPDNLSTISYSDYQTYARRNLNWTKRLQPILKQGQAFICLNAIYLGGEDGLLNQLKNAGYKVKAVNKHSLK